MVQEHDPEPERYYDWMMWKLRQTRKQEMSDDPLNSPTDDVTKGDLSGWLQANNSEKPYMSKEDLYRREIAEMQKTNHTLMMRVKEQAEQIEKLEKKIDAKL